MIRRSTRRLAASLAGILILLGATLASLSWTEPPRFDGAGYAMLGRSLAEGRGYREINAPVAVRHAHFPPAYPALLALVWTVSGTDDPARFTRLAHLASLGAMLVGVWGFARWWQASESRGVAGCLTLALASNWAWARTGGVIRSEPLAIALGGLILLAARRRAVRGRGGWAILVLLLGAGVLTRQVMACWALALAIDAGLRQGRRAAVSLLAGVGLVVAPWVGWQIAVGSGTQTALFQPRALVGLAGTQALFYARRIPDAIAGPFVEVATVFARSPWLDGLATLGAVAVSLVVVVGWVRLVRSPRRRLGGLIPLTTLPLLLVWPFTEAGRFLIPLIPFILMGATAGGGVLLRLIGVRRGRTWASRLVLAASIPYAIYAGASQRAAAERLAQRGFDAACAWVARQPDPDGRVMARHPADVAWSTGRLTVAIPDGGPARIAAAIRANRVAYLLVDDDRYARSPGNPLHDFVTETRSARRVWTDGATTAVYQIVEPESSTP